MKTLEARIDYPHAPKLLKVWSRHVPNRIKYRKREYELQYEITDSITTFVLRYTKVAAPIEADELEVFKQKEGQQVLDVINHIVTTLRTFDHSDLSFKRLVAEDQIPIKFVVYNSNDLIELSFDYAPLFESPLQFRYLFTQLEDHDGLEGFHFAFEDGQLFAIALLIEANHSLMKGEYNVCVLHCCTAIESCIFPIIESYLRDLMFNKGSSNIKSIMKELPMNIKYELMFGTVEKEVFKEEGDLLGRLKKHNKLRNSIIHSGNSSDRKEAFECLNDASRFIGMVYLQMKDLSS